MATGPQVHGRRSAAEWARLVRAWKRSGLSARKFAASASVAASTLTWWQWQLAQRRSAATPALGDEVQLVQVEVAQAAPVSEVGVAWELVTERGLALRVHRSLPAAEVTAIVEAFVAAAVRA
jgi:transposase